jgi:hypothetical protein
MMGHHDLALRFASGQAMRTNSPSGQKSSADVQTPEIIRLVVSCLCPHDLVIPARRELRPLKATPESRFGKALCFVSVLPAGAIQSAVVDGFAQVFGRDFFLFCEVRDGPADPKDLVMSSCRQTHVFHRSFQKILR